MTRPSLDCPLCGDNAYTPATHWEPGYTCGCELRPDYDLLMEEFAARYDEEIDRLIDESEVGNG
jgi:hypothetical protein